MYRVVSDALSMPLALGKMAVILIVGLGGHPRECAEAPEKCL